MSLFISNRYNYPISVLVIDELPVQLQIRDWQRSLHILSAASETINYPIKPLTRGEYVFDNINVIVNGPLKLTKRRYSIEAKHTVKVYPSFVQMRRFQLLAATNRLQEAGIKRIRRLGHSSEFEQIKEYVRGDDYRTINWKATGRRGNLMINNYTDEKSQQVYCIINKGRVMKMPFDGMTLLDYAINASLVLSNIAMIKQDKAGLVTFAEKLDTFLTADKKPGHMNLILESLYKQQTNFLEADYEKMYATIRNRVTNRGLVVLFTNFESLESLKRDIPAFKKIAHYHLLLIVFFENTAIKGLIETNAEDLEQVYIKTIAEKFSFEKKQMVKELQQNGILSVLTTPEQLTVNTINKYLELKNRNYI
ncbi:DUF58 domain-containing protein [Niabella ginsengisoli]|uniref:DUF58 domain-containing protein n=1 Tax=Niabella ginsengisoli TaxID=522298 RepID=A0ABS9SN40_9BACT|nr:DUF58 domain-containing protein [Niabella ginsengisoli]MCH5599569.1 DUF58 domain-containing protein [Niabella ginsengisoli]